MKYKFLFTPLGLNAHWCFPCDAFGFGTAVAGIANMIGTQIANSENVRMQKEINQRNIDNQWQMFHAQNVRQDYLNRNQDLIKRQSLVGAGLNVNSEFGGYPNISTNSIPFAEQKAVQVQPIDATLFAQMLQQAPLVKAQARQTNADAEAQEIENKRMKSEDAQYSAEEAMDAYNKLSEEDKVKQGLPPVEIVPRNKGWFDAHRNFNQFKGEESDVSLRQFSNAFNESIVKKQMASPKVLEALENMPYRQYESLIKQTDLAIAKASESRANKEYIDSNKAYIELKTELERDGNIFPYISKLFDGSFDFEDFVKCLVLVGIKVASK